MPNGSRRSYVSSPRRAKDRQVLTNDRFEAGKERARDDRVADRHLIQVGKFAKQDEVLQIEIVAGVDAEADRAREARRLRVKLKGTAALILAALEGASERLGVKLHAIGTDRRGELHGVRARLDKQAHPNAVRFKRTDHTR